MPHAQEVKEWLSSVFEPDFKLCHAPRAGLDRGNHCPRTNRCLDEVGFETPKQVKNQSQARLSQASGLITA